MLSFFRFRPDPFRFRAPQIRRRFFPLFQLENWYLLGCQFGFRLDTDAQTKARLQAISPGTPTIILANHTNFADPHVVVELAFQNQFLCHWLAGIEPFDTAWGIYGWHLQRIGCMSVDRGVLDRWSLKTAQKTLEDAQVPLIIFPEGEADYSNRVLQPLYGGAAQMALHAQKHHAQHASPQSVQIIPLAISYGFKDNPTKRLQKALKRLYSDIYKALDTPQPPYPNNLPLWEQAQWVLQAGLNLLNPPKALGGRAQMAWVQTQLATAMMAEHDSEAPADALSRRRVMDCKNRWRSLIARKRYAPDLSALSALITQLETAPPEGNQLTALESRWIGLTFPDLSLDKRVSQLLRHLKQQRPYAQALANASPADLARWTQQMDQTRQIKLLTLIGDDLDRADTSYMGVDELLTKMEILFLGAFRYRKGHVATVRSAPPIVLTQWIETHLDLTDKARSDALTQTFETTLSHLLTGIQGAPPWQPNLETQKADREACPL